MKSARWCAVILTGLSLSLGGATVSAQGTRYLLPQTVGDMNAAQLIEVKDSAGQVLLHGTLETTSNSIKETERKAALISPTGQKSKGEVDVDIERKNGATFKDEVEIQVERLPSMLQCELFIDGQHVTSFVTNKAGKAALKLQRTTHN